MGKHRKRNIRRAVTVTGIAAALTMLGGIGYALAKQPSAPVRVALAAPVLPERITSPVPAQLVPEPSERIYTAKDGDSLWSMAARFCHDGNRWGYLARANHISYPYPVTSGQRVSVRCA